MYALKLMTEREGRKVEESHYLGNMYRLEFFPVVDNPDIATRLEYSTKEGIPAFDIKRTDHAYITTVTGDTVRVICRGKVSIGSY